MTATHLHWHNATSSVRVKDHFDLQLGKMLQASSLTSDDREVDYVSVSAVQWGRFVAARVSQMYADTAEVARYSLHPGDLLVCEGGEGGRAAVFPGAPERNLIFQNHVIRANARSARETSNRYLRYVLECASCLGWLTATLNGATIRSLSKGQLGRLQIPWPAVDEQRLIVRYLDHAETRIAKAIAGKSELVRLLQEKRQVVVEEVVLGRTLGRSVVDTGIPWIGKMPSHWELAPLRSFMRPRRRLVGREHVNHALLSLTLGGVILRDLSEMKGKFPASFESYQEVRSGDFVMCLFDVEETPRTVGLSSLNGMITGAYDVFESLEPASNQYLYEYLLTVDREKRFEPLYRGLRKTVPRSSLLAASVPVPPAEERNMLVDMAQREAKDLDRAIASLLDEIALLKEYRVRLISDVVTGKLDVRKEAASLEDVDPSELAAVLAGGATSTDEEEGADGDE